MFIIPILDDFVSTNVSESKIRLDKTISEYIFSKNFENLSNNYSAVIDLSINIETLKIHLINMKSTYRKKFGNLEKFYKRLNKIATHIELGETIFHFRTEIVKSEENDVLFITRPTINADRYDFALREINLSPNILKSYLIIEVDKNSINIIDFKIYGFENNFHWKSLVGRTISQYKINRISNDLLYVSRKDKVFLIPKKVIELYLKGYIDKIIPLASEMKTQDKKNKIIKQYQNESSWDSYSFGQHAANAHISKDIFLMSSTFTSITQNKHSNPAPQLILQGPPGTGKSHKLSDMLLEYGIDQEDEDHQNNERFERVVGHPELTSADFIGQYRPMTKGADKELEYSFVPGPFTRLLKQALNDPKQAYILIIEELNRTNAAAMFAEVFQLLDRRANGQSQYTVNLGLDVNRYLLEEVTDESDVAFEFRAEKYKVRLPANFAIWATMNTADQGVFPMDTAFKRRWSFEYLGVDEGEEVWGQPDEKGSHPWDPKITDDMTWQMLRKGINQVLSDHGKDEDRQLGGFFLTQRELGWDPINECLVQDHLRIIQKNIMTKVVGYLRDDVLRYEPQVLFEMNDKQNVKGFSGLISQMKAKGTLSVFRANDVTTWKTEFAQYIAKYQVAIQKDKRTQSAPSSDDSSLETANDEPNQQIDQQVSQQNDQESEPSQNDEDSHQDNEN
jgi:hypothetical protein